MSSKEWKCLLLIIVIFISACIETDIYLPAFPDMITYFSISEMKIQSLLTWNFFGICISGPFYGPISDSIGRKKPLIFALGLFLIGSLFTLVAHTFEWMLVGRILQGLGSGGCFTLGTALIFDAFQEKKAIDALNKINTIIPFIMAGAPMLGGYLNQMYGFRSNFLAIALCVLISLILTQFFLNETLPIEKRSPFHPAKILRDFKQVALSVPFWQTTCILSFMFAGYLTFLSGISVLFVLELGVSKESLPYFQGALLGSWLLANLLNKFCIHQWGIVWVKRVGIASFIAGGLLLVFTIWLTPKQPVFLTIPMLFYGFGANWVNSIYFPEGMDIFPDIKGVTASFITSARLLVTAGVVGLASAMYDGTIYPIALAVFGCVTVILISIVSYEWKRPQRIISHDMSVVEIL